jgi:hypothetical protein
VGKYGTGYARVARDEYPTPPWVIGALAEHIDLHGLTVWEMACGSAGQMAKALKSAGCERVYSTDIVNGYADQDGVLDFLSEQVPDLPHFDAAITNPPYGPRGKTAEAFIARGCELLVGGYIDFLALLLPHNFDSAKIRAPLFGKCPFFAGKITLLRRPKWFEHPDIKHGPKENIDWFLWSRSALQVRCQSFVLYAPSRER